MCPGEVSLENWKMSLTWSRVQFRLQNRISAFHCGERACWYSSVRHLSILKAPQALSVSTLEPWWRRAKNPDLTAWVRVSVESSPKPLGNPSTAPKHPFLEVSLSLPPMLIFAASGIERLDSFSKPVGQKFVCLSDLDCSFPSLFLEEKTWIVASRRSFLRRLCISGHNASKHSHHFSMHLIGGG